MYTVSNKIGYIGNDDIPLGPGIPAATGRYNPMLDAMWPPVTPSSNSTDTPGTVSTDPPRVNGPDPTSYWHALHRSSYVQ